jgi:hypothetical protein
MSKRSVAVTLMGVLVVAAMVFSLASLAGAGAGDRTMYKEGTGQALIYPLWVADGTTDTLFEIVNRITPIFPTAQAPDATTFDGDFRLGRWVMVRIQIREEKNSEDALNFDICLSPGDVWTAGLTLQSGITRLITSDESPTFGLGGASTPLSPTGSPLSNPTRGYIEAVMIDNGTSPDTGCDFSHGSDFAFFSNRRGGQEPLFGREIFVNTAGGLATGFNAEALEDLWPSIEANNGTLQGSARAFRDLGLGEEDSDIIGSLMGRWLRDASASFDTQVVVTFPTGKNNTWKLCDGDFSFPAISPFDTTDCDVGGATGGTLTPFDFSITSSTTMALWIRNDEECVNHSPRQVPTPNEVNVITFSALNNHFFSVGSDPREGLKCTTTKATNPATFGWFRLLFDVNEDEMTDYVKGVWFEQDTFSVTTNHSVKVPRVIPAVGFVTITAPTAAARISATFPFQTERPFERYNCDFSDFECSE